MRLTPILLLASTAVVACRVAATASELAPIHGTTREDSARNTIASNKLRRAGREEERLPLLSAEEKVLLEKVRSVVKKYPVTAPRGLMSVPDQLALYRKLRLNFDTKDELYLALELAERHFDTEEDVPLIGPLDRIKSLRRITGDEKLEKYVETYVEKMAATERNNQLSHTQRNTVVDDGEVIDR